MRRKMYATAMTAMLVTGTLMGLAVPAAERDGVTLHGDSTYDSIEKITDEDLTLKIMLAIRDGDTIKAPEELAGWLRCRPCVRSSQCRPGFRCTGR